MIFILISSFAYDLFKEGDYYRAISEYKRELFLGIDSVNSIRMIGECYRKLGEYDSALYWYSRLNFIEPSYEKDYEYLLAITLNIEDLKIISDDEKLIEIISEYERRSKTLYLSYLFPGSSQIIYGHFKEGFFSFFWNALSISYFIFNIKEKDYFGALFTFPLFLRFYEGNIKMAKEMERKRAYQKFKSKIDEYFNN